MTKFMVDLIDGQVILYPQGPKAQLKAQGGNVIAKPGRKLQWKAAAPGVTFDLAFATILDVEDDEWPWSEWPFEEVEVGEDKVHEDDETQVQDADDFRGVLGPTGGEEYTCRYKYTVTARKGEDKGVLDPVIIIEH